MTQIGFPPVPNGRLQPDPDSKSVSEPQTGVQQGAQAISQADERSVFGNAAGDETLDLYKSREWLFDITGGWPKVVSGRLCDRRFDPTTGRLRPCFLENATALFAWIDRYCKVIWNDGRGYPTKAEFYQNLLQNGEQFVWATDLFHYPPLPNVLYTSVMPDEHNTGRLDELIDMFDPHTPSDRVLLKAFACTPFWGGPTRKRPLFVISTANAENDADAGRGSGKTTGAQTIGKFAGGCFAVHRESEVKQVLSDLLSPNGMDIRIVLFDNVKALKFSSEYLESLITMDDIGGHIMYVGHGRRPNYMTFVITANEPMLSTDLATRSIPVLINQSKKTPDWDDKLDGMLADAKFHAELLADIHWHLRQPVKVSKDDPNDRWSLWWREVASRLCTDNTELNLARETVRLRRQIVDADLSARELITEVLERTMIDNGIVDPDTTAVFFPTVVLLRMLAEILGRNCSLNEAGQRINAMKPRNFYYRKSGPDRSPRGFWWIGNHCDTTDRQRIFKFVLDPVKAGGYRKDLVGNIDSLVNLLREVRGERQP